MNELAKRGLLISNGWIQGIVIVVLCGFLILGMLAYRTYTDEPPIPSQVVDPSRQVLFTGAEVIAGQEVFLRNGLMEYGSIFGHGAYLGPDFTADYLHRAALIALDHYGGISSESAKQQTITDFKTNRYDGGTGVLSYSAAQAEAFEKLQIYYADFFGTPNTKYGLRPSAITDPQQIRQLTAFFSWSAWAGSARRPNLAYLLHKQLATGAAGRKLRHRRRNRLECPFADRSAGWHRALARGVWPLEFPGLARSRRTRAFRSALLTKWS